MGSPKLSLESSVEQEFSLRQLALLLPTDVAVLIVVLQPHKDQVWPHIARADGARSLGEGLRYGNVLGREVGRLFDPVSSGARSRAAQIAARDFREPALQSTLAAERGGADELIRALHPHLVANPGQEREILQAANDLSSGRSLFVEPELAEKARPAAEVLGKIRARRGAEAIAAGIEAKPSEFGENLVEDVMSTGLKHAGRVADAQAMKHMGPEAVNEFRRGVSPWLAPGEKVGTLKAFDAFTNAFKALSYPFWPASHIRNLLTGGIVNLEQGVTPRDYMTAMRVLTRRGNAPLAHLLPGIEHLSPEEQIQRLASSGFQYGKIGGGHQVTEVANLPSGQLPTGGRMTPMPPLTESISPTGNVATDTARLVGRGLFGTAGNIGRFARDVATGQGWRESLAKNLGIRGVGGVTESTLPLIQAGQTAGTNVENLLRTAMYHAKLRQGFTPELAGEAVRKWHMDYSALTPFQKNVMSRVFPFGTFMQKNLPLQVEKLMTNPGLFQREYGALANLGAGQYKPEYLGETAVPVGREHEGKQTFVSRYGMPAEEAFSPIQFTRGVPNIPETAMNYAAQMNPLIRAPLEHILNREFYTGRPLNTTGRSALGTLLSESPAGRFYTTAQTIGKTNLTPAEKVLALTTGIKVSDVDLARQQAMETRSAAEQQLARMPHITPSTDFFVKPENREQLNPDEVRAMQVWTALQKERAEYAKKKKLGLIK